MMLADLIGGGGSYVVCDQHDPVGTSFYYTSEDSVNRRLSHTVARRPSSIFRCQSILEVLLLSRWKIYTSTGSSSIPRLPSPNDYGCILCLGLVHPAIRPSRRLQPPPSLFGVSEPCSTTLCIYNKTINYSSQQADSVLCLESPSTSTSHGSSYFTAS